MYLLRPFHDRIWNQIQHFWSVLHQILFSTSKYIINFNMMLGFYVGDSKYIRYIKLKYIQKQSGYTGYNYY